MFKKWYELVIQKTLLMLFIVSGFKASAQADLKRLIHRAPIANLPYTTGLPYTVERNLSYFRKMLQLHAADSASIVQQLKNISPKPINPNGGSLFGSIDCTSDFCFDFNDLTKISLICAVRFSGENYLMHLKLEADEYDVPHQVLAYVNSQGVITDWFYANGAVNTGNSHGNLTRDFTILKNELITINEHSWGSDVKSYGFRAVLKVLNNKFLTQSSKFSRVEY
jgi:hypothetical protein